MNEGLGSLLVPLGFFAIFYFLVIRPQQKRNKAVKELRDNLKVGDEIITIGGIYGSILKIKDDMITIETGEDKNKITITKWSVGSLVNKNK
ncbi:MAG: preprotein translocase subunit YajC [Clostridiales bacterium]|nr:preprotein translocase subunit YajC [Clostridiales bacterium]